MKNVTLSEWEASSPENRKLLAEESLILEASEAIWTALEEEGLSKSELAAKLKVSKSHVTQLLDGSRNMTLRTLANLADVLGRTARIELRRENIDTEWIKANGIANVRILRPQQALRAHANDDGWQPLERAGSVSAPVSQSIAESLAIKSVLLRSCSVDLDDSFEPFIGGIELEVQIRHRTVGHRLLTPDGVPESGEKPSNVAIFDVDVGARFVFKDPKQAVRQMSPAVKTEASGQGKVAATFSARYSAIYDIRSCRELSVSELTDFGTVGPLLHIWPYWRELLQSLCGRVGINPVMLPLLVVEPKGFGTEGCGIEKTTRPKKKPARATASR